MLFKFLAMWAILVTMATVQGVLLFHAQVNDTYWAMCIALGVLSFLIAFVDELTDFKAK